MRRLNLYYYLLIAFLIIALDQVTKILVLNHLVENVSVSLIGDLLYLRLIFNEGGAMGTSFGPSWLYMILTIVALILIIRYFITSQSDGVLIKFSLALILGGAIGNLIDRIAYGRVIDFIDMDFPDISAIGLYRWYTYNVADAAISVGLVVFAVCIFIPRKHPTNPSELKPEVEAPVQTDPSGR
ncbi:MAG: signal peptidase II [candidate division Zixibacteria bacterium RBG_16_53_22]|nr:MAG: signal peptidase II [candidate division Zixibacteria bacterium RBG_16_53_22]